MRFSQRSAAFTVHAEDFHFILIGRNFSLLGFPPSHFRKIMVMTTFAAG
jgi:hypothetical protein